MNQEHHIDLCRLVLKELGYKLHLAETIADIPQPKEQRAFDDVCQLGPDIYVHGPKARWSVAGVWHEVGHAFIASPKVQFYGTNWSYPDSFDPTRPLKFNNEIETKATAATAALIACLGIPIDDCFEILDFVAATDHLIDVNGEPYPYNFDTIATIRPPLEYRSGAMRLAQQLRPYNPFVRTQV